MLIYTSWDAYVGEDGRPRGLDWSSVEALRGQWLLPHAEAVRQALTERNSWAPGGGPEPLRPGLDLRASNWMLRVLHTAIWNLVVLAPTWLDPAWTITAGEDPGPHLLYTGGTTQGFFDAAGVDYTEWSRALAGTYPVSSAALLWMMHRMLRTMVRTAWQFEAADVPEVSPGVWRYTWPKTFAGTMTWTVQQAQAPHAIWATGTDTAGAAGSTLSVDLPQAPNPFAAGYAHMRWDVPGGFVLG